MGSGQYKPETVIAVRCFLESDTVSKVNRLESSVKLAYAAGGFYNPALVVVQPLYRITAHRERESRAKSEYSLRFLLSKTISHRYDLQQRQASTFPKFFDQGCRSGAEQTKA